jgi:hypothetical protein
MEADMNKNDYGYGILWLSIIVFAGIIAITAIANLF